MIGRLFDFGRWCRWTSYAAGVRQARLMDAPYPTAASGTAYTVVTPSETTADGNPTVASTFNTTPYESLLFQHGEFEITKILRKWNRRRHALVAQVYFCAVQTRHIWPEWCEWRRRAKAAAYRRSAAWSPFFHVPTKGILAACEFPLMRASMETFRLTKFETQVAAAGAAVGLIYLSHLIGRRLRERRWGSLATICAGVAAASLLSLAVLRSDFLEHAADERAKKTAAAIAKAGLAPAAAPVVPMQKPLQNKAILLTLMTLFFVTGVVVAYESHEPSDEIREISKNKPKADRRFDRRFKQLLNAAAVHDRARDEAELSATEEKERTLVSDREFRFANGLWRTDDLPVTFAESVDERFFKSRDFGPHLLPMIRELERLFAEGDQTEVDNFLARLFSEMYQEATHEA